MSSSLDDPNFEDEDCVIVSLIHNKDGSITAEVRVNAYFKSGKCFSGFTKLRLHNEESDKE